MEEEEGGRKGEGRRGPSDRTVDRVNEYVCVGNLDSHARKLLKKTSKKDIMYV